MSNVCYDASSSLSSCLHPTGNMARETRQPAALAITFVILGLATVVIFLRIALRVRLGQFHLGKF